MFEITDINELYALQKGLMEIRFNTTDVDWAVQGSPVLGQLHQRVVEAIIRYHERSGEHAKAEGWREWRRFDRRVLERTAIREYLRRQWSRLTTDAAKREAVNNQMRPFAFSENDVEDLLTEM